jgi:hypothetical protein
MTLPKLIKLYGGKTLEEYESMTDQQIEQHFAPYFKVTRPTKKLESKPTTKTKVAKSKVADKLAGMSAEQLEKLKQLKAQYGIN